MGSLSLLQGIFPTQGLNLGLLHCRRILDQLSHKGNPTGLCLNILNVKFSENLRPTKAKSPSGVHAPPNFIFLKTLGLHLKFILFPTMPSAPGTWLCAQ